MAIKFFNYYLNLFGVYPKKFINSVKGIPSFIKNYFAFKKKLNETPDFYIKKIYPCLSDRFETAGSIPLHYFYQDLYIANKIFKNSPEKHVDIGSRIDGFTAHVASFRKIEVFDIRKFQRKIFNINFIQADLMEESFAFHDYCDSVSSLHAIEHFGLGRYGDKIDPEGHLKGLNNIYKLLKENGIFYFSTPIGQQRIEFDAHRVFSIEYLLKIFDKKYNLKSFSYINDKNDFFGDTLLNESNIKNNFGCKYGCGIFELIKI